MLFLLLDVRGDLLSIVANSGAVEGLLTSGNIVVLITVVGCLV